MRQEICTYQNITHELNMKHDIMGSKWFFGRLMSLSYELHPGETTDREIQ